MLISLVATYRESEVLLTSLLNTLTLYIVHQIFPILNQYVLEIVIILVIALFIAPYAKTINFFSTQIVKKHTVQSIIGIIIGIFTILVFPLFLKAIIISSLSFIGSILLHKGTTLLKTNVVKEYKLLDDNKPNRTNQTVEQLLSRLKHSTVTTINLDGGWGSGKTYILKSLYNKLIKSTTKEFQPIYLSLDQVNTTQDLIKRFSTDLNSTIYSLTGIRTTLNTSLLMSTFTHLNANPFIGVLINIISSIDISADFAEIRELSNTTIVLLLDDVDRIINFQELKFVLEFITYLRESRENAKINIKVIYASDNAHLFPLVGYHLLESKGAIELAKINSNYEIHHHQYKGSDPVSREISLTGELYMRKYCDLFVKPQPLKDSELLSIIYEQLIKRGISEHLVEEASGIIKQYEHEDVIGGDFRIIARLLIMIDDQVINEVNNETICLHDYLVLSLNIHLNSSFSVALVSPIEYVNNNDHPQGHPRPIFKNRIVRRVYYDGVLVSSSSKGSFNLEENRQKYLTLLGIYNQNGSEKVQPL